MKIICILPVIKYFEFFEELNETFGDDWSIQEPEKCFNNFHDFVCCGNSIHWNKIIKEKLIKKENEELYFKQSTRIVYAYLECPDNVFLN